MIGSAGAMVVDGWTFAKVVDDDGAAGAIIEVVVFAAAADGVGLGRGVDDGREAVIAATRAATADPSNPTPAPAEGTTSMTLANNTPVPLTRRDIWAIVGHGADARPGERSLLRGEACTRG